MPLEYLVFNDAVLLGRECYFDVIAGMKEGEGVLDS